MKIITISEARAFGLTRYFTGKPCKRGHIAERSTANNTCVKCGREQGKQWEKDHPEVIRERAKAWKDRNPEKVREQDRRKHARHRDKRLAYMKQYREANRAQIAATVAAWFSKNPDKARAIQARRRARELNAAPKWLTAEDQESIASHYAEARRLEELTGKPHHVDHIVPLQGERVCGLHVPWNLMAIPAEDNLRKHNKFPCE